jgi:hypothetical protein
MNLLNCLNDKAVYMALLSYGISLSDIDILLKILIGFVTIFYVGYKALNEKKKYEEK